MHFSSALFREAASQWSKHNAPRLGAALAYYTALSLAPMLVIIVAICGLVFGDQAVRGQVYWQFKDLMGDQGAEAVQSLLKAANRPKTGAIASVLGFVVLLLGASGVFVELRDTLNYIWDVPVPEGFGFRNFIRYRFLSFAMLLGVGFLLMISLVLSAVIQAVGARVSTWLAPPAGLIEGANFVLTFLACTFLFALIYRFIPQIRIEWEDVAIGSVLTAAFFAAGKFLIGLYLGKAGVGSAYGAAGSLVVLLVWVYYSAQIFLFGAEITRAYVNQKRPVVVPAR